MTVLALRVLITDTTQVNRPYPTLLKPFDGLFDPVFLETPETGEVVHDAIGYHAQCDTVAHSLLLCHQTVDGIVERRVATNDNDGLIAVADQHPHETFHTISRLALHKVILHLVLIKHLLDLLPTLTFVGDSCFRAIQDSPSCCFYCHVILLNIDD